MSLRRWTGSVDDLVHVIMMCTEHPCIVKDVKDPTGSGRVRCECQTLFGDAWTFWIPTDNSNAGPNDKGRKQTGLHNPAKPGDYGTIYFVGGNLKKPAYKKAGNTMYDKGNSGSGGNS